MGVNLRRVRELLNYYRQSLLKAGKGNGYVGDDVFVEGTEVGDCYYESVKIGMWIRENGEVL